LPSRATSADYLAAQGSSELRLELIDGVIVAMAGGSHEHNAIGARFVALFVARVPRGCRGYTPGQRYWIAAAGRGRYSDASIICGKPEAPAHDRQAAINPTIVVEVLSPSSEGDDEGEKRRDFQTLASLQAYALAAQDSRCIKVFRRSRGGEWLEEPEVYRLGDRFVLPGLTAPISVDEIYDDILDASGRSLLR
jgi:Uma2 family endonuclease